MEKGELSLPCHFQCIPQVGPCGKAPVKAHNRTPNRFSRSELIA